MRDEDVIIKPVITEKSSRLAQDNQVVFAVHSDANKIRIAEAVRNLFKVKVVSVRTITIKGKRKRRGVHWVARTTVKRAVVTLVKGQQIDPASLT